MHSSWTVQQRRTNCLHNADALQNPAMLDALIGVYERNVLGYPSTAVLPYSQALSRFPAHLQQAGYGVQWKISKPFR